MLDIGDIIFGMPESYENGEVMKFRRIDLQMYLATFIWTHYLWTKVKQVEVKWVKCCKSTEISILTIS